MYVGIGVGLFLLCCLMFVLGKRVGSSMSIIKFIEMQEDIDGLTASRGVLVKQLETCRNRSAERKDQNDELKEELYAYKKRYGGLD